MTYASQAASVVRQIGKFGRLVTLRRVTAGTLDTATDTITGAGTTDATVKAVVLDYQQREIDGDMVIRGDKRVLIAAADLDSAPAKSDRIIDGGVTYQIENVEIVGPGDTDLLYKLQVRK